MIRKGTVGTQEEIVEALNQHGYDVNQSKISRLLRKLLVVKIKNKAGETIYSIPKEPAPPTSQTALSHLIMDVSANEQLIIIHTSPGSASLIARMLDYHEKESMILGTIAGDDTIFVSPKSVKHIQKTLEEVKNLLTAIK